MRLKKINAVFALLSALTLLLHIGYNVYAYMTFYYNPLLKTLSAVPFLFCVCIHAVCGMCVVFMQGDGTRVDAYGKQNRRTVMQRVSAALIFPLLILHMRTFSLLQSSSSEGKWFLFALLIIVQILFFAVVCTHTATSFSKAFITLGILQDRQKQRRLDHIIYCVCAAAFVVAVFAVVKGELSMFVTK